MKNARPKPIRIATILIFTLVFLSNCASNNSSTPSVVAINSPTPSPKATITQTTKPKSDQTQTTIVTAPAIAPVVELNQQCEELTTSTQSNQFGTLLFQKNFGDPLFFFDLKTGNQKFVPSDQKMKVLDADVSPNGRWLLYELDPKDGSSEYNFILADASGNTQKELPFGDWGVSSIFWLNENVVRVATPDNAMTYISNYAFNPFDNIETTLLSNFPGVRGKGVDWGIDKSAISLGISKGINIIYDPTLTKAIYPKSGTSGSASLFNLETNQEISTINGSGRTGLPKWSPTGEMFSVIKTTSNLSGEGVNDELVIYSSDALEIMRMGYLRQESGAMRIENYSWSRWHSYCFMDKHQR